LKTRDHAGDVCGVHGIAAALVFEQYPRRETPCNTTTAIATYKIFFVINRDLLQQTTDCLTSTTGMGYANTETSVEGILSGENGIVNRD